MSSSLLLQQCPACLVRLTCIVFVMGGKCPCQCAIINFISTSHRLNIFFRCLFTKTKKIQENCALLCKKKKTAGPHPSIIGGKSICNLVNIYNHFYVLDSNFVIMFQLIPFLNFYSLSTWRCPWCSRYRRRKWTQWHEFKSWTRLIACHIALIPLRKVWIQ